MKPYKIYAPERTTFKDRVSGATVHQLTNYLGHSVHPYFTDNAWIEDNKKFIFTSDRENVHNLFSYDLESGEIAQLTDFSDTRWGIARPINHVNKERGETYFWQNRCLYGLDLKTLAVRPIFIAPANGYNVGGGITGAGGKYLFVSFTQDLSDKLYTNLSANYIGFDEMFEAHPHCIIYRIDLETGKGEAIWDEHCWIGHVNPSPTVENILTFCHEGPWDRVDNRMWTLDTNTGKAVMLRPRNDPGEMIGHEYWLQDGIHVGYQVHVPTPGNPVRTTYTGFIKYDGTDNLEALNGPMKSPDHVHSLDKDMIVCDAGTTIHVIRREGDKFAKPRILAMHNSSFSHQNTHPHPSFTPDGKAALYASDSSGYINLYLAELPAYEDLPELEE